MIRTIASARLSSLLIGTLALGATPLAGPASQEAAPLVQSSLQDVAEVPVATGPLVIERGEGRAPLRLPREEKLVFGVRMEIAIAAANVGRVTMRSNVEPYRQSVLGASPGAEASAVQAASAPPPQTASLRIAAKGSYAWYSMDASIETRLLPQDWPAIAYRYTHSGSETRRREILLGSREGEWTASYRKDTRKGAPKGTRIWRDPKTRAVPKDTLDLMSAVFLARTLVQDDLEEVRFPLIDKLNLWDMRLRRGERKRMETEAGTFDVVQVVLDPAPMEGEEVDEEKARRFEGLFGLHGSIRLWVEANTGVPVRIQGSLPVGPLDLEIDMKLEEYAGTPAAFGPVGAGGAGAAGGEASGDASADAPGQGSDDATGQVSGDADH